MQYNNIILELFCSRQGIFHWLQNHLLPCPFKYLTGIDCPGCGFQRAIMAALQGNFGNSWAMYPPAIPLTLFFIYGFADRKFKLDNQNHTLKKTLYVLLGAMVAINYGFKLWHMYLIHYKAVS